MKRIATILTMLFAVAACSAGGSSPAPTAGGSASPGGSASATPSPSPVPGNSTPASIKEKGRLTCGVKFDVVGFGFKNPTNSQIEGFDADICREIAKKIGVEAELIEAVSANRIPFLNERRVDLVISTFTINDDRKKQIDFSRPYYVAGQSILAKISNTAVTKVDDLNGKNVCSAEGSTSEKNVREKAAQAKLVLFKTYTEAGQALSDGRCDAVSTDDVILFGLINAYPDTELKGEPFTTENYGIGMKKDSTELKKLVDDELAAMDADGRFKALWEKNIGKYTKKEPKLPPAS
ncbi:MAG: transporter substrate-binding domain-containing protein [Chloroflexi bacterium]|nr:transporter substrate-binding domain-containing protein [Chloroflexota bacterium]